MKTLFAYLPVEGPGYLCLSQNRFSKFRGDPELIYPIIPAMGMTLWNRYGYEVSYIDSIADKLDMEQFISQVKEINPDLLVYETKTPVVKESWGIVDKLKEELPNLKIAVVGDHVSVLPEETMENSKVDFVITGGDFDVGMLGLAKYLEEKTKLPAGIYYREDGKIRNTGPYKLVKDIEKLPWINRDLIPWQKYHEGWRLYDRFMYLMGSRGCPYKCSFCSWPQMLYKETVRFRDPRDVAREMEYLIKHYKVEEFFLDDDTFTCNKQWVLDFCDELIRRDIKTTWSCNGRVDNTDEEMLMAMKEAGCRLIKYGVESASQYTLNKIQKGYTIEQVKKALKLSKKIGILRHSTAMIGYPWETKQNILDTINLIREIDTDTCQFSIPIAYPGTRLFEEAKQKGWLRFNPGEWEKYDMSLPTLKNEHLSAEEVIRLCESAWKKVYFQPRFIFRKIFGLRKPEQVRWIFRGVKTVLKGHVASLHRKL